MDVVQSVEGCVAWRLAATSTWCDVGKAVKGCACHPGSRDSLGGLNRDLSATSMSVAWLAWPSHTATAGARIAVAGFRAR